MKPLLKNIIFVFLIFISLSALFSLFFPAGQEKKEVALTELVQEINQGEVKSIIVSGNDVQIVYQDNEKAKTIKEPETSLSQSLLNYGVNKEALKKVKVETKKESNLAFWLEPLLWFLLPLLLFGFFFWTVLRQAKSGVNQAFDFTRAKAKLFGPGGGLKEKITFNDIAGVKEAKDELHEIIDFLKNPQKYLQMGAKIPRGVLLIGMPGTGKTMLAKAVANESGVPFFSISGSEFIELFVGVGASRVRNLFDQARKAGRAIIFVDEIDSIGKMRGVGVTGGHEEREQTLNQLLAEMDGIGREENIIVMAATNRPENLDPALLRPGRFDRRIVLDMPDLNDREDILKIHCRGKSLDADVNLREVAERTSGFSGADLANVVNEAALLAAKRNKFKVSQKEFLESIEKVLLGPERKSHALSKEEKEIAAYHEAGHALVASLVPGGEPVRKISIIARGMAAGYTLKMPTEERRFKTKTEFLAEISTLLAGYCAEKIKFNEVTTGAENDLERASQLARKLVKEYGMSKLGPISFGEREKLAFLNKDSLEYKNYSEQMAQAIDKEVFRFVKIAQDRALEILRKRKRLLERLAQTLIEKETIEREEFEKIIKKGRDSARGKKKSEKGRTKKKRAGEAKKEVKVKIKKI